MALMRWDPFGEMLKMQRDLDRIFSRTGTSGGQATMTTSWMPRINVKQSGEDLQMQVELAGIKPEDVDIEVTDGVLTVKGDRKSESEREDEGWIVRESSFGSFERAMVLPEGVDPNSINADFHDGMLDVTIPKAMKQMQPQTTKVAIGGMQGGQPQGQMGQGGQGQGQQGGVGQGYAEGQGQMGSTGSMGQNQTETVQSPDMQQMSQSGSGQGGTQYGGQGGPESSQSPIPDTEAEESRTEQPVGSHRSW